MTESTPVVLAALWKRSNENTSQEQGQPFNLSNSAALDLLENAHAIAYGILVAFTICFYDYLLSVGDEVELFWKKDYNPTKVLYLVSRYFPLIALILAMYANAIPLDIILPDTIVVTALIFGLRIYTIYYNNKLFQQAMIAVFAVCSVALIILTGFFCQRVGEAAAWSTLTETCTTDRPSSLVGLMVTSVILETALAGATLWHAISSSDFRRDLPESPVVSILNSIYLQGGLYYLLIAAGRLTNTFLFFFANPNLFYVYVHIEYALASVITTRWSLVLRHRVNQTAHVDNLTLHPRNSHSRQFHHAHNFRQGSHSQSVSARITFFKGSKLSSHYGYVNTQIDVYPEETGVRTIPELPLGPVDEDNRGLEGSGLPPLTTRSESDLGEALAIHNVKNILNTSSLVSSAVDGNEEDEVGGSGAPVYKCTSTSASTATVGVRASIGSAVVERGTSGVYSIDLNMDIV